MRNSNIPFSSAFSRGFSIIETMIGMVIALAATLIIFQMFSAFEGQKRTTTGGADATDNGMFALMSIERDARMAGTGVANRDLVGCLNLFSYFDNGTTQVTPAPNFANGINSLMPVRITDGGNAPDIITFTYGNSVRSGVSSQISADMPQSSAELNVVSTAGFRIDDLVIVVQGSNCTVMQITQVQTAAYKVQHNPGNAPSYNPAANLQNANNWPAYTAGAQVFSLGGGTTQRTYSVGTSGPTLALLAQLPTDAAPVAIAGDIVSLQAQYGIAPVGSQQVNCWVNATAAGNICDASNWANPTGANILRIKAVRIAVVARSALSEKRTGGACSATTVANAPQSWTSGPTVNLAIADPNWQCYRYKTFQTITPLRNVLWANL